MSQVVACAVGTCIRFALSIRVVKLFIQIIKPIFAFVWSVKAFGIWWWPFLGIPVGVHVWPVASLEFVVGRSYRDRNSMSARQMR